MRGTRVQRLNGCLVTLENAAPSSESNDQNQPPAHSPGHGHSHSGVLAVAFLGAGDVEAHVDPIKLARK